MKINRIICSVLLFFFSSCVYAQAVNIAIFLDRLSDRVGSQELDHIKKNKCLGAIAVPLIDAINQNVPVIVASSAMIKVLLATKDFNFTFEKDKKRQNWVLDFFDTINKDWFVYRTENKYFGIFIHKQVKSLDRKALGLDPTLEPMESFEKLKEIFDKPAGENDTIDVKTLLSIFQGEVPKFVYIGGHGYHSKKITELKPSEITKEIVDGIMVAQLSHKQNQKFLTSMNKKGCLFIYYYSCYAGGLNLHLMNKVIDKLAEDKNMLEESTRVDISFPIVAGAVADTFPLYPKEISFTQFFEKLDTFFIKKLGVNLLIEKNIDWIEKPFRNIVKYVCGEHLQAIPTILLPGVPSPMKTIVVDDKVKVLTYPYLIAHELKGVRIMGKKLSERIKVVEIEGESEFKHQKPKSKIVTLRVINNYKGERFGGWAINFKCFYKKKDPVEHEIKYKSTKDIFLDIDTFWGLSFSKKAGRWGSLGIEEGWHKILKEDIQKIKNLVSGDIVNLEINRTKNRYTLTVPQKRITGGKELIEKKREEERERRKKLIERFKKLEEQNKKAIEVQEEPLSIGYNVEKVEKKFSKSGGGKEFIMRSIEKPSGKGVLVYPMIISVPLQFEVITKLTKIQSALFMAEAKKHKNKEYSDPEFLRYVSIMLQAKVVAPKFISMIPGKAHHYIEKICVENKNKESVLLKDLICNIVPINPPVASVKCFFIRELECTYGLGHTNYHLDTILRPKRYWIEEDAERALEIKNLIVFKPSEHRGDKKLRKGFFQAKCEDGKWRWVSYSFEIDLSDIYYDTEKKVKIRETYELLKDEKIEKEIKKIIAATRPLESAVIDATGGLESIKRFNYLVNKATGLKIVE